jgi:hypothetical protein
MRSFSLFLFLEVLKINNYYGYSPYQPMNNGLQISYVNGLAGAKGYSLPPNTTIFLMDSDAPQFYIKTSDRNGMCTIKAYKFEEIQANGGAEAPSLDLSNYVTKQELSTTIKQVMEELAKNKGGLL